MKLIDDAKQAPKFYSMWAFAALAVVPWLSEHSGSIAAIFPQEWQPVVISAIALLGAVARLIKQEHK